MTDLRCKAYVSTPVLPSFNTDRLQFGRAYICLYFLCDGGAKLSTALALYRLFEPRALGPRILAWCSVIVATLPIALSLLIFNINCSQPFAAVADNAICPMQVSRLHLGACLLHAHSFRITDQSVDRDNRHGHRRRIYDCPMCSLPGLSSSNQATPEDRGSGRLCCQSCLHSLLDLGLAHDAQDVQWLRRMDDAGLRHYDHRGESLPCSGNDLPASSQAYDPAC